MPRSYFLTCSFHNDDMKSSKRHVTLLSLIFLLKHYIRYRKYKITNKEKKKKKESDKKTCLHEIKFPHKVQERKDH